jgi:hypothetical protein
VGALFLEPEYQDLGPLRWMVRPNRDVGKAQVAQQPGTQPRQQILPVNMEKDISGCFRPRFIIPAPEFSGKRIEGLSASLAQPFYHHLDGQP